MNEKLQRLADERAVLGHPISGHETDDYVDLMFGYTTYNVRQLADANHHEQVVVLGYIAGLETKVTEKAPEFATFSFEDATGSVDGIMWHNEWKKHRDNVHSLAGRVNIAIGKITVREGWVTLVARDFMKPSTYVKKHSRIIPHDSLAPDHNVDRIAVELDEFSYCFKRNRRYKP